MSALDYARRSPALWSSLGNSLKESHQPLHGTQRSEIICDTIRRAASRILQLPEHMDNAIAGQRVDLMITIISALAIVGGNDTEKDWLMGMKELLNYPLSQAFRTNQVCGLCGGDPIEQAALYACRDCLPYDNYRCQRCYLEWSNGEDSGSTDIPAWKILEDLEADLVPIRRVVACHFGDGAQVIIAGLELTVTVREWIKTEQARYGEWDQVYNSNGRFKKPTPGRGLLQIMLLASQLSAEQERNEQLQGMDASTRLQLASDCAGQAAGPATPLPSFKELDERLKKLFRKHSPERETAPFECIGHKLHKVPLGIDWAKEHALHDQFDDTGHLTRNWLEGLLQRYSPAFAKCHGSACNEGQHDLGDAVGSVKKTIDQAISPPQLNANPGTSINSAKSGATRVHPTDSLGVLSSQPVRLPATGTEISPTYTTATASLTPFNNRNIIRNLPSPGLLPRSATLDILRDEAPALLRGAVTFDLRAIEQQNAIRAVAL